MCEPTAPYSISPKTLGPVSALWLGRHTLTVSQRHFKSHRFQTKSCLSSSQHLVLFLCFHPSVVLTKLKKHQTQHGRYPVWITALRSLECADPWQNEVAGLEALFCRIPGFHKSLWPDCFLFNHFYVGRKTGLKKILKVLQVSLCSFQSSTLFWKYECENL